MSGGSEFHAAGPACEKTRSPNLVGSRGCMLLEADRRPGPQKNLRSHKKQSVS